MEDLFCSEVACSYLSAERGVAERERNGKPGEGVQEVELSLREETLRI